MKILHIIPTLSGSSLQYGGPSIAVLGMCAELSRRGVSVTIATTHEKGADAGVFSERLKDAGGALVHYFPKRLCRVSPSGFAFSPSLKKWLNGHLGEFDLIDIHTIFAYPSTQGCLCAIRYNMPYILRPCGMLDAWCLRRSRLKKAIWMLLYGRQIINRAAMLHFTSDDERKTIDALHITAPNVVIPLGVTQNEKDEGVDQSKLKSQLQRFSGKKKILFLSRIHPKKGLDLLIPALGLISKKRNDFIFILAGRGELKHQKQIKDLLSRHYLDDRTIITGFVEGIEKSAALSLADIFVLPSYQENFGLAVAEAMSAGLAVVISGQVNIHREVSNYNAGIVTACDAGEVAAAIERLLDDDAMRKKMGENGKRLVYEKFNWNIIIPKLINLYEQILGGKAIGTDI